MTAQRASRIAGGIAFLAVLSVVTMVTWSMLNRSEPELPLPLAEGPAMGELTGYVGRVDPSARTVDVADNPFGLRPVVMVVTSDTAITVEGKQGAIGDLSKDMPVRAVYEVRNDVKYVTSIQVIAGSEPTSTASATPPEGRPAAEVRPAAETRQVAGAKPVAETKPPVETRHPAETKPVAETKPPVETRPPAEPRAVAQSRPVPPPAVVAPPAAPQPPAAPPAVAAPPRPAPAPAPASAPAAASVPSPPRPASDAGDGSAAIDWLFERRR